MRRLHLKLFYLRTRLKREAQGVTAKILGVRPATMSHLEQGRSLPTLPMLLALCKHYDVTPTYLLDDERPIDLRPGAIAGPNATASWRAATGSKCPRAPWSRRTTGCASSPCRPARGSTMQRPGAAHDLPERGGGEGPGDARSQQGGKQRDRELEETLSRELLGQRKPRNKPVAKSVLKSAMAQMAQG
jgi:DNA-binding XRE family transcriptional regulator